MMLDSRANIGKAYLLPPPHPTPTSPPDFDRELSMLCRVVCAARQSLPTRGAVCGPPPVRLLRLGGRAAAGDGIHSFRGLLRI